MLLPWEHLQDDTNDDEHQAKDYKNSYHGRVYEGGGVNKTLRYKKSFLVKLFTRITALYLHKTQASSSYLPLSEIPAWNNQKSKLGLILVQDKYQQAGAELCKAHIKLG